MTALVYGYGDTVEAERLWGEMSGQAQVQYRDESFLREVRTRPEGFLCPRIWMGHTCVVFLRRCTQTAEAAVAGADGEDAGGLQGPVHPAEAGHRVMKT